MEGTYTSFSSAGREVWESHRLLPSHSPEPSCSTAHSPNFGGTLWWRQHHAMGTEQQLLLQSIALQGPWDSKKTLGRGAYGALWMAIVSASQAWNSWRNHWQMQCQLKRIGRWIKGKCSLQQPREPIERPMTVSVHVGMGLCLALRTGPRQGSLCSSSHFPPSPGWC